MVFFCCNACGQSVKKNAVEKHWQAECASCWILSCLDCGKDFVGDDYKTHTSCVTEAEKYQGDLFKGEKGGVSKGEKKQQEWLESVSACLQAGTYPPRISSLLKKILQYPNIPRKKAKFQNFVKNSINVYDQSTLDSLWDIFNEPPKTQVINTATESAPGITEDKVSEEKTIKVEVKTEQNSTPQLGVENDQTVKRKGKKRKKSECEDEIDLHVVHEITQGDEKNLETGNESNDQTVKRKKKRKKSKCGDEIDLDATHEIKTEKREEPQKPAKKKKKKGKKKAKLEMKIKKETEW